MIGDERVHARARLVLGDGLDAEQHVDRVREAGMFESRARGFRRSVREDSAAQPEPPQFCERRPCVFVGFDGSPGGGEGGHVSLLQRYRVARGGEA
jgi:hypothetical protein